MSEAAQEATPLPALKPCPFCGAAGKWVEHDASTHFLACSDEPKCWAEGPARNSAEAAGAAWNSAPRLADGLRPEPAASGLDNGLRLLLEALALDQAETRRLVVAIASALGVDLTTPAPAPKRVRRAL